MAEERPLTFCATCGVTRIDRFCSMSDMKYEPLVRSGIAVIERIPIPETRNYVQRVIENVGVYRNRLSGRDQKLAILTDVYGPNVPKPPVLKYAPPRPVEAPRAAAAPMGGQASATP